MKLPFGIQRGSEVKPSTPQHLWYPYIVKNAVNIFFGSGGTGKTTLFCAICSAITSGKQPPDMPGRLLFENNKEVSDYAVEYSKTFEGMEREDIPDLIDFVDRKKYGVLYCTCESTKGEIRKKVEDSGGDVSKLFLEEMSFSVNDKDFEKALNLLQPRLVILDPVASYASADDFNAINKIRIMMDSLTRMARDYNVTFVLISHPPKGKMYSLEDRCCGSKDFINACRSAVYIGQHPDIEKAKEGFCVGYQCKQNCGGGDPFVFQIGFDGEAVNVDWHGTDSDITRAELESADIVNVKHETYETIIPMLKNVVLRQPDNRLTDTTSSEILCKCSDLDIEHGSISSNKLTRALKSYKFQESASHEGIIIGEGSKGQNKVRFNISVPG